PDIVRRLLAPLGDTESLAPLPARRAPFVGRKDEEKKLSSASERMLGGQTSAVIVEGESGVGKSALVRKFARDLEARGDVLVRSGRCYERELMPYKALDGVMDALCEDLAARRDAEIDRLVPVKMPLLGQVFPVLRKIARFDHDTSVRLSRPVGARESR